MKILFIAPSTEPGKSGVGDYALALAGEVSTLGHEARVAASGIAEIRSDVAHFRPDWISLQFVSYAFDRRGLVWGLGRELAALDSRARWQVMFHELWIGAKKGAPLKERLLGLAQRTAMLHSLAVLKPALVHTSNPTYRALLARAGIEAGVLPLFGNIPIAAAGDEAAVRRLLIDRGVDLDQGRPLLLGLFGSLHPIWPPEPFFTHLHEAAALSGRPIILLSVGRLGPGKELWETLKRRHAGRISLVELGEQPPGLVSRLLRKFDFGIAATPYQVIGKSGSAVAMVEHGLPVIVNRTERYGLPTDDAANPDPLYIPMTPDLPQILAGTPPRRTPRSFLPEVARQFVDDLARGGA